MKKLLALLVLSLTLFAAPSWAQKVTDLPAATVPLAGTELLSILQPGTTSGTTSQVSASAIASAGGDYYVRAYNAKCDGMILYTGVRTTYGSNIISSYVYTFTSADIGKHVSILGPAAINQSGVSADPFPSNPPESGTFTGTITGVSGGSAVLSGNLTFTEPGSYASYQGAALRMYLTDDTTAIQAALDANHAAGSTNNELNGGKIVFPPGVCATGQLTFYGGQKIVGADQGGTVIMLKNGANSDLFESYGFATYTGTNQSGPGNFVFEDLTLDGNRSANTGSNAGLQGTGTGDGIRAFGYGFLLHRIAANFFAADGIYTEWSNGAGSPCQNNSNGCINATGNGMESWWDTITTFYNADYGIVYQGPTDSNMNNLIMAYNGVGGLLLGASNGTQGGLIHNVSNSHTYSNGLYGYTVNLPYGSFTNDEAEGNGGGSSAAGWLCNATCQLINSYTANTGSTVGMITGSGAVLNLVNSSLNSVTLGNSSTSAVNTIINSYVGTINSGAGSSLNPAVSVIQNNGTNPIWNYSTSSTNGPFQITNSGGNIALEVLNTGKIGIGTSTPAQVLDVRGLEAVNGTITNGTIFTVASGCGTTGSPLGGTTAGSFTAGATSCAPVITLPTAPNGWICHAHDITNPSDAFTQTATSTTSCTVSATVTSSDLIQFDARGY